jgi:D-aminoacyl-tRNA deacylase
MFFNLINYKYRNVFLLYIYQLKLLPLLLQKNYYPQKKTIQIFFKYICNRMKVILQRVSKASVEIDGMIVANITQGLLLLVGIVNEDTDETVKWMSSKIANMRIFADSQGLMNRSIMDVDGEIIVVSQFTLYGDAQKGNRPSFIKAAKPETAIPIYEKLITQLSYDTGKQIQTGQFGADMQVSLVNDGPVTIVLEK